MNLRPVVVCLVVGVALIWAADATGLLGALPSWGRGVFGIAAGAVGLSLGFLVERP